MPSRGLSMLRRSAVLAAALSFVVPGLGQLLSGAWRRAVAWAFPTFVAIGFVVGAVLSQGRVRLLGLAIQPEVLLGLIVANVVVFCYRLAAMVDAYLASRRRWPSRGGPESRLITGILLGALLLATVGMHTWLGVVGAKSYDTIQSVFASDTPSPRPARTPRPTPVPPGETPGPTPVPTPEPTPKPTWSTDGRLDLLLVGGDAGPGRFSLRTDTMILLSVDVASGRAAMFGIPRNMINVPLPDGPAEAFACGCYNDLLNSLYVYAGAHPGLFRGEENRGYLALQDAVGELVRRPIDGMLVVTLQGFVRLVDALGGLDITTPYDLYDSHYPKEDGSGSQVLSIPAGFHHFDGHDALAFARSRHQDSDYDRMYRQQLVLLALRRQVSPCDLILRIPELLDIARDSLWTNLPIRQIPDILALANTVETNRIARYQFWPPDIPEVLNAKAIGRIRSMVADPFSVVPSATPLPSGATPTPEAPGSFC